MTREKSDLLRGTLDMLILEVLAQGALHGYAIGRRIQERSGELLRIEQGSLYPALYRLHRRGWIKSRAGTTETGRKARIYRLTATGRKRRERESAVWHEFATGIGRVLDGPSDDVGS